jgi:hypothetical protein
MFKSYVIIEFEQDCTIETKAWFEEKLKTDADLLTKFSTNIKTQVKFIAFLLFGLNLFYFL